MKRDREGEFKKRNPKTPADYREQREAKVKKLKTEKAQEDQPSQLAAAVVSEQGGSSSTANILRDMRSAGSPLLGDIEKNLEAHEAKRLAPPQSAMESAENITEMKREPSAPASSLQSISVEVAGSAKQKPSKGKKGKKSKTLMAVMRSYPGSLERDEVEVTLKNLIDGLKLSGKTPQAAAKPADLGKAPGGAEDNDDEREDAVMTPT